MGVLEQSGTRVGSVSGFFILLFCGEDLRRYSRTFISFPGALSIC